MGGSCRKFLTVRQYHSWIVLNCTTVDDGGCPWRYFILLDPNGDDGFLVLHDAAGNVVIDQHLCRVTFCCNCGAKRFGGVHHRLLSHQLMRRLPDSERTVM